MIEAGGVSQRSEVVAFKWVEKGDATRALTRRFARSIALNDC